MVKGIGSALLIFLIIIIPYWGKTEAVYKFEKITQEQGLPHSIVFDAVQDQKGFIWFGTAGGYARYDGITFRYYPGITEIIYPDQDGQLWIGNRNEPLTLLDPATGQSEVIAPSYKYIVTVYQARNKIIYFVSKDGNILSYDKTKKQLQAVVSHLGNLSRFSKTVLEDTHGNLWFGLGNLGLLKLSQATGKYELFTVPKTLGATYSGSVESLHFDMDSTMWVAGEGVWHFDRKQNVFRTFAPMSAFINSIHNIAKIVQDHNNDLWFGSNNGLFHYQPTSGSIHHYEHDPDDPNSLSSNSINSLLIDQSNVLWITTTKGGVNKIDINAKKFFLLQRNTNSSNSLSNNQVTGVYEDSKRNVWIFTDDMVLNRWNRNDNTITKYPGRMDNRNGLRAMSGHAYVTGDKQGNIWVAPWLWTLNKISLKSGKPVFDHYESKTKVTSKTPGGWSFRHLLVTSKNKIWIAYSDAGIDQFDPLTGNFIHFQRNSNDIHYALRNYLWTLAEDPQGNIWGGHSDNGFIVFDTLSKKIQNYLHPSKSIVETYCILMSESNIVYMGTSDGIFAYTMDSKKFITNYSIKDGLPNSNVRGILEDKHQNLWISTDKGLAKLDPKTGRCKVFNKMDGLPSNEFSISSYYKNQWGEMYFGSINGLVYFHPDSIRDNPIPSKAVFTNLKVLQHNVYAGDTINGRIILQKDIAYTSQIELEEADRAFSIEFASLHYSNPQRNRLLYKLEGWDKEWILTTSENSLATYTNLPAGKYYFKIKSSNRDEVWNEIPTELQIIISPPFWNSLWFRLLLAAAIIFCTYIFYMFKTRSLKKQKILLKQRVKEQTQNLNLVNEELKSQKDKIETQYKHIQMLAEIGQKITSSIKAVEIIENVYQSVNTLMDAQDFSIGIIDKEKHCLLFYGYLNSQEIIHEQELSLYDNSHLSVWCVNHVKPVFMSDVESQISQYIADEHQLYTGEKGPRAVIYMPLVNINQQVIGVLQAKSFRRDAYQDVHFNILQNLASYISIALDNASAYEEIETQSQKLKEADALKSRFLTNITHEFKTPLTLLLGPLEKLHQQDTDLARRNLYDIMQRNAKRLQRLIHQLLELSKIDEGAARISLSDVDISKAVQEITNTFSYMATELGIDLRVDVPFAEQRYKIDSEKFEEIIYNLVSNAIKYTGVKKQINPHALPEVVISLSIHDQTPSFIELKVKDNGIGIDENEIDKIFNRFYRVDNQQVMKADGIGVGLSLTKKLVELMGGHIAVSSQLSRGTEFTVKLPIYKTNKTSDSPISVVVSTTQPVQLSMPGHVVKLVEKSGGKILLVEDNPDLRAFLKICLEESFEIIEAENGAVGLDIAMLEMPDIIISDIMMPEMDGFALCKKVKSNPVTDHIPVILLTAKNDVDSKVEGFQFGADEYLTKPFDREILLSRVKNILETRRKLIDKFGQRLQNLAVDHTTPEVGNTFLQQIIEIIEENIGNNDFSVDQLAHTTGMSRTLFFKKFLVMTGNQPNDFIRKYRLKRAVSLFDKGNQDIAQVAYQVGFEYANYFSKCFKDEFGHTPSEYIRKSSMGKSTINS